MEDKIKENEELEAELDEEIEDMPEEFEEARDEEDPLEALQNDIKDLEERLLRAKADADNARRRAKIDVEEATKFSISGFAKDIIDIIENLQRALDNIPSEKREEHASLNSFAEGIEMTMHSTLTIFERYGIKRVAPKPGDDFDHNYHQAMAQVESEEYSSGKIVDVYQAGYTLYERLLKPAMVTVAK